MMHDDFYQGVICALAVVHLFDEPTVYKEIVNTIDEEKLIKVARRNGDMRWSGLSAYLKSRKP